MRRLRHRHGVAVLAAGAVLLLAGCGGDEEAEREEAPAETGTVTEEPAGEPVATVEVSETDFELDPANPTVDESGLIEFVATNDGGTTHALEVEGPEGEAVSDTIEPGESTSVTADLPPGEYTWYCPVGNHRELGMEGTVTVAGGEDAGGGTETEDEDGSDREREGDGPGY